MAQMSHSSSGFSGLSGRLRSGRNRQNGWTLIELIVVAAILAILGVAITAALTPEIQSAKKNECFGNLQMIESAKNAWVSDHPGQSMTGQSSQLIQYLRGGQIPTCPSSATPYLYLDDPSKPVTCTTHNQQAFPTPTP
jgi:prepilin-type N-terminal cleavage/methylation domain-containing protein